MYNSHQGRRTSRRLFRRNGTSFRQQQSFHHPHIQILDGEDSGRRVQLMHKQPRITRKRTAPYSFTIGRTQVKCSGLTKWEASLCETGDLARRSGLAFYIPIGNYFLIGMNLPMMPRYPLLGLYLRNECSPGISCARCIVWGIVGSGKLLHTL